MPMLDTCFMQVVIHYPLILHNIRTLFSHPAQLYPSELSVKLCLCPCHCHHPGMLPSSCSSSTPRPGGNGAHSRTAAASCPATTQSKQGTATSTPLRTSGQFTPLVFYIFLFAVFIICFPDHNAALFPSSPYTSQCTKHSSTCQ